MSASREKNNRKNSAGQTPAVEKQTSKSTGSKVLGVVAAVLAVVIVIGAILVNTTFFTTHATAVTVGAHKVSPAEYNIFYRTIYSSYYEQYGENMMSYLTEVLKTATEERIKQVYAIYDAAVAEGLTLSEETKNDINEELGTYKDMLEIYGYRSVDQILASMMGSGVTESVYRHYREVLGIVADYAEKKNAEFAPTDAELDAYYAEHADDFDTVTFRQFAVSAEGRTLEDAQKIADEVVAEVQADPSTFAANAEQYASEEYKQYYAGNPDITLLSDISISSLAEETKAWLSDPARTDGDTTAIVSADQTNVYVLLFLSRGNNQQKVISCRDLFVEVAPEADEETRKAAEEKIQGYLKEYNDGEKTRESFIALINKYGEDPALVDGLRENISPRDEAYMILESVGNIAADEGPFLAELSDGYHLLNFEAFGESYAHHLARTAMETDFENDWIQKLSDAATAKTDPFGMKFVQTNIAINLQA